MYDLSLLDIVERAKLVGNNVEYVVRELFQKLILFALVRLNIEDHYVFQGGTAIRLVYGSPRFSLDMDFAIIDRVLSELEQDAKRITRLLNDLLVRDKVNVMKSREKKFPEEGFYRCFLVFDTRKLIDKKTRIKLELSAKKLQLKSRRVLIEIDYPFKTAFSIICKTQNQILSDKIAALAGGFYRGHIRWRDLFDIYWLVQKHSATMDPEYFRIEFGSWVETVDDLKKLREYLHGLIRNMNYSKVRKEMSKLLHESLLTDAMLKEYLNITLEVINNALKLLVK